MTIHASGKFFVEFADADGTVTHREELPNAATNVFMNYLLSVGVAAGSQLSTWYLFLIDNAGFTALSPVDTMGSHAGWTELTGYSESARQQWSPTVASLSASDTTVAVFTASGTIAVAGVGLCSVSTKGGSSGTLGPTGQFSAVQNRTAAQTVRVVYVISLSGS